MLGLRESAATKRYLRALRRLKDILSALPGGDGRSVHERRIESPDDDPLGPVVESFLARFRRRERPALTELIARHPELAGEIRELIPALVELELLGRSTGAAISRGIGRGSARSNPGRGPVARAAG